MYKAYEAVSRQQTTTLTQPFQPMAAKLSMKSVLPLASSHNTVVTQIPADDFAVLPGDMFSV